MAEMITILEARRGEAREALDKLARRAARYSNEPIDYTIGPARIEQRPSPYGRGLIDVAVCDVVILSGNAPRVGEHQFVARIEITPHGAIIDTVPGEHLPERFRQATDACEHCSAARSRRHLFVVRDPAGELVQVGRTCLRDYLGIDAPAFVAGRFNFLRRVREWSDEFSAASITESVLEILAVTSAAIRRWGWKSVRAFDDGASTAAIVRLWSRGDARDERSREVRAQLRSSLCNEDWQTAESVIAWVSDEDASGSSDYMHNLRVAVRMGVVEPRRLALVCSAVASYQRHIGELKRRATLKAQSQHVGTVGERLRGLRVRVDSARGIDTAYGRSILYTLIDQRGNSLSWLSSSGAELEPDTEVTLDATVKGHREFRGVKETQLTRAKVLAEHARA